VELDYIMVIVLSSLDYQLMKNCLKNNNNNNNSKFFSIHLF
jgi:hypothetical protein